MWACSLMLLLMSTTVLMVSAVAVLEVRYPALASGGLFGMQSHVLNNEPRKKLEPEKGRKKKTDFPR